MVFAMDEKSPSPPFSVLVKITIPKFKSGYIVTLDSIPGSPPVCDTSNFPTTSVNTQPKP